MEGGGDSMRGAAVSYQLMVLLGRIDRMYDLA